MCKSTAVTEKKAGQACKSAHCSNGCLALKRAERAAARMAPSQSLSDQQPESSLERKVG